MPSFVDVLYQRYSGSLCEDDSIELFIVGNFSPGKSGNQLTLPPALSLTRCNIYECGSENIIRDCCKDVEELDLASNNLTDLNQVFKIIKEMPFLKFLNLSENNFSNVNIDEIKPYELHSVHSLVLNNTKVPWNAVNLLLDYMPNLIDLHLSLNNYTSLEIIPKCYKNIKRIYISKNPNLINWEQIKNLLLAFPNLESLTMADCNLKIIPDDLKILLPNLQSLNISNWPIDCWSMIDKLNTFPKLTGLRCQGIHILNEFSDCKLRRNMLIARLPKIKRLNGSEITNDERLHAERDFIRWYTEKINLEKPKRYYELFKIYGVVGPLLTIDLSPPKEAQVKIILLKNENDKENENKNKESKLIKVNLKQSVKNLKNQISCEFGLPCSKMRIFYVDHEMVEVTGPEELRFNQKKLYTYNVRDGDEFLVAEKN